LAGSTAALAVALLAATASAQAVSVSGNGLGQVLLYPYYTVRSTSSGNAYSTLFTVTNTAEDIKVVRVRFREGRNGREVASVNVYLAPQDSWTGAVVAGADGPLATTFDESCTDPPSVAASHRLAFTNLHYLDDGEDRAASRAGEGYFEVFELGVVRDTTVGNALDWQRTPRADCAAALSVALDDATRVGPPTGGLMGWANVVNGGDGTSYAYEATALADFSAVALWSPPGAATPTLADVNPKVSRVADDAGVRLANWDVTKGAAAADPVSAVLMANQLINWFVRDAATASATDWVVTMPTKPFYTDPALTGGAAPRPPFESAFASGGAPDYFGNIPNGDCSVGFDRTLPFDREGRGSSSGCFLPPPPIRAILPWTVNVAQFSGDRNVFASSVAMTYGTIYPNGWAKLVPFQYPGRPVHRLVSTDTPPVTFVGLPMIGFMANDYVNRTLEVNGVDVLSNYGATSAHRRVRVIQ
jgi:hypothetical protein